MNFWFIVFGTAFLLFRREMVIIIRERLMVNVSPITDPPPITCKFHFSICRRLTPTDSRQELGAICCEPAVKVMVRFHYNLLIPADRHVCATAVCDTRFIFFILSLLFMAILKHLTFTHLLSVAHTLPLKLWLNLNFLKFTELAQSFS